MNPEKSIKLSVQVPLFLLLNLILYFLDLWTNQALLCLVIDVILFGKIVNDAMKLVPVRFKKRSERFVTLLFPILLLSIWEIFASTGKINPTWFPEPTNILASLGVDHDPGKIQRDHPVGSSLDDPGTLSRARSRRGLEID